MSKHLFKRVKYNWMTAPYGGRHTHGFGLLFNPGAWWIGAHYSPHNKRLCVNLLPCLTIWYVSEGGNCP